MNAPEHARPTTQAFVFQFLDAKPQTPAAFDVQITEPADAFAAGAALDPQALLDSTDSNAVQSLKILWAADGASGISDARREAWLAAGLTLDNPKMRHASVRGTRIAFAQTRAVINCPQEALKDSLDAVLRFAQTEWALQKLEQDVHRNWKGIAEDAPLLHEPGAMAGQRRSSVAARMENAAAMKAAFLRISLAAEQLDPRHSDASKRLFGELADHAALHDRIEMLDDPVQFMMDHYEIIMTRKDEMGARGKDHRAAFWGHALEIMIIIVLLYQAFFTHHS